MREGESDAVRSVVGARRERETVAGRIPPPKSPAAPNSACGFALGTRAAAEREKSRELVLLQESLRSPESHAHFAALTGHWLVKLFLIGMLWSFLHHFFAGLRFLLLDVHVASDLGPTRAMSAAVLVASLLLTAILGACLW